MRVIAAGKAAMPMARAARELFGDRIRAGLIVGAAAADPEQHSGFQVIVGGHPTPSAASEQGGRRALELAASLQSDETLVVLLWRRLQRSYRPADGMLLEDKQAATRQLLRAGADIHALNTVRKHLRRSKAAGSRLAHPAHVWPSRLSDVVGDDLERHRIRSHRADASTFRDALDIPTLRR
jgi:glycerate-2-kinase